MSWQYSDAPSHIAPETGPNLLTGPGPWTVALEPGQEYVLTVDVLGTGDTLVEWQVSVTDSDGGELEYPAEGETVPGGEWVTVTRPLTAPAFEASASVALTAAAQTRDPSLAALTGRTILTVPGDVLAETIMASGGIVAGTPGGARVELTDEGLAAFDTDGTETAQIRGAGGEFVGGEFRTSDDLPGRVTLSDTAVEGVPGVQVVPADTTGYTSFPGVTYSHSGMMMWGGRDTTDRESEATLRPDRVYLRSRGGGDPTSEADILVTEGVVRLRSIPDASVPLGDGVRVTLDDRALNISTRTDTGWSSINVLGTNARIANGAPDGRYTEINTDWASARVVREAADGTRRALVVDDHGVWAETDRDGVQQRYNLEETAQDSGWIDITHATGYRNTTGGAPFQYRRMGGMIHLRGRIASSTGALQAGTAHTIGTLPSDTRPTHTHRTIIAGGSTSAWGRIDISGGTGALTIAPISANMDWIDLAGTMWTVD